MRCPLFSQDYVKITNDSITVRFVQQNDEPGWRSFLLLHHGIPVVDRVSKDPIDIVVTLDRDPCDTNYMAVMTQSDGLNPYISTRDLIVPARAF